MATLFLEIEEWTGRISVRGSIEFNPTGARQHIDKVNPEELDRYKELCKFLSKQTVEWYKKNAPEAIPELLLESSQNPVESSSPISNGSY